MRGEERARARGPVWRARRPPPPHGPGFGAPAGVGGGSGAPGRGRTDVRAPRSSRPRARRSLARGRGVRGFPGARVTREPVPGRRREAPARGPEDPAEWGVGARAGSGDAGRRSRPGPSRSGAVSRVKSAPPRLPEGHRLQRTRGPAASLGLCSAQAAWWVRGLRLRTEVGGGPSRGPGGSDPKRQDLIRRSGEGVFQATKTTCAKALRQERAGHTPGPQRLGSGWGEAGAGGAEPSTQAVEGQWGTSGAAPPSRTFRNSGRALCPCRPVRSSYTCVAAGHLRCDREAGFCL